MRPAILASVAALLLGSAAQADEQVACTILGCEKVEIEVPRFASSDSFTVQEVWAVVNDILGVSGLAPNFQVVETQEVGNAAAVIIENERYLAFNPIWMRTYRDKPDAKWQLYAVMAHEVGHHLQGHTITGNGSRPPTELEADEYAGFTLAALGATLDQSLALWRTFGTEGSATHPPRDQRLQAVERGWVRRKDSSAPAPTPAGMPKPATLPPLPVPPVSTSAPVIAGQSCQRWNLILGPAQVCTSTTLDGQKGNTYFLGNMFDNDARTAWVEGAAGNGIGQAISISFDNPTTIRSLKAINGYGKSNEAFDSNGRVEVFHVTTSTGVSGDLSLTDTPDWQSYDLTGLDGITWITFTIKSVYPGSKWQDVAFSELVLE